MPGTVAGVASERDVLVLQAGEAGDRLLDFLDARHVVGKQLHVAVLGRGCDGLTLVLSRENLHDETRLRQELSDRFASTASLVDGLGAVSVVGTGINATYANVRRGTAFLRDAGIAPSGIATSSFRITWLVARDRLDDAVRGLHEVFIEPRIVPDPERPLE